MSKKKKCPKSGAVWKMSAVEATLAKKPHYNGFACGHGVHGDVKYNRAKQKRMTQKFLVDQGASRGSFSFAKIFAKFFNLCLWGRRTSCDSNREVAHG